MNRTLKAAIWGALLVVQANTTRKAGSPRAALAHLRGELAAARRGRWLAAQVISTLGLAMSTQATAAVCVHPAGNELYDPWGDVSLDGKLNVSDVACILLASLSELAGGPVPLCLAAPLHAADLNCDSAVNTLDATLAVYLAIQEPLPSVLDGDADGCTDSCAPCATAPAGSCLINGECVVEGELLPNSPCRACAPDTDPTGWTVLAGGCPGGEPCLAGVECASGFCDAGFCSWSPCVPPCGNGGSCDGYGLCDCAGTGYAGAACELAVCEPDCENGGVCVAPNQCDCAGTGYSGTACETLIVSYAWTDYGPWSNCSLPCGGGVRSRSRSCIATPGGPVDAAFCGGASVETEPCNTQACPGPCVASSNNFQSAKTCTSQPAVTPGGWLNMPRPYTPEQCRAFCDQYGAKCCMHLKSGKVNGVQFANGGNMCGGSMATGLSNYSGAPDSPLWTAMICQ